MKPSAPTGQDDTIASENPEAPGFVFSWHGIFSDPALERTYRKEAWPVLARQQGSICGIGAMLFLLAGLGPILEMGATPMVVFISLFRLVASALGVVVFFYTRKSRSLKLYAALLILFITCTGGYEAVEAVLTYSANLEFSTPFTLLIIFLLYILFPLHLAFILPPALFSSIAYVSGLRIFVVGNWSDLLQLSVFFFAANLLGSYILIRISRSSRIQFAYNKHVLQLNSQLRDEMSAKNVAYAKLEELSVMDALTQLANRRKFMDVARHEWAVAERYEQHLSMMIIDVDNFKQVNDTYGHSAGDEVLMEISKRMQQGLRETDLLARLGGEEFGLIMPNTSVDHALHLAERLRKAIVQTAAQTQEHQISVSVSIGVSQGVLDEKDSFQQLFNRADNALYHTKRNGRNKVRASD